MLRLVFAALAGRRFRNSLQIAVALVTVMLLITGQVPFASLKAQAYGSSCSPAWSVVKSPRSEYPGNNWYDVSVFGPNDAWAVGRHWGVVKPGTMTAHWDGRNWKMVPSPSPGGDQNDLWKVSQSAADDAWAIGSYSQDSDKVFPLVIHWDGHAWSQMKLPKQAGTRFYLTDVLALAADDVWVVGTALQDEYSSSLIWHWTGSEWEVHQGFDELTQPHGLGAVSAVSPDNIWAVGTVGKKARRKLMTAHYDGVEWAVVSYFPLGKDQVRGISDIAVISSDDIWAVGQDRDQDTGGTVNYTLHWDGANWNEISTPTTRPIGYWNPLAAVTAISSDNVWTAGADFPTNFSDPLSLNWNGTNWSQIPMPRVGTRANKLLGIDAVSAGDLWAVGYYYVNTTDQFPLIEHFGPPIPIGTTISPAHKSILAKRQVSLDWQDLECATTYQVMIKHTNPNGETVVYKTDLAQSQAKTKKLTRGTKYVWSVRGCNADGCGFWSKWRSFQIAP